MVSGAIFRYLLRPLSGPPLLLTIVVSLLGTMALFAGPFGFALASILAPWVWSYAYLLVDYTARGLPAPVLTIENTAPWHEPRPLVQIVLLAAAGYLVWYLHQGGNDPGAFAAAAIALVFFPASLAVLAVEGHVGRALWPPALLAVVHGIGLAYLVLIAIICGIAALVIALAPYLSTLFRLAVAQLGLYAIASCLGGALYERRLELGLEAWQSPEREAAKLDAGEARKRDRAAEGIYVLVRAGNHAAALTSLGVALGAAPTDPETYRWFRDRAASWQDRRIADRLTSELVSRLLILGRRGEALAEVESWWQQNGRFVPRAARDLDVLKSVATELAHPAARERLSNEAAAAAAADRAAGNTPR